MISTCKGGFSLATDKRPTMLRLPEDLYEKVRYLAYFEHRSLNMEIEYALQQYIAQFEEKHGEIKIQEE